MRECAKRSRACLLIVALAFDPGCAGGGQGGAQALEALGEVDPPPGLPLNLEVSLEVVTESDQALPAGYIVGLTRQASGFTQRASADKVSKVHRFLMLGLQTGDRLTAVVIGPAGGEISRVEMETPGGPISGVLDLGRVRVELPEPTPARSLIAGGWISSLEGQPVRDGSTVTVAHPSGWRGAGIVESGRFTVVMMDVTGRPERFAPADLMQFSVSDPSGDPPRALRSALQAHADGCHEPFVHRPSGEDSLMRSRFKSAKVDG